MTAQTRDDFPGVLGDYEPDPTEHSYPDPNIPAAPNDDETVLSVLKQIRNRLPAPPQYPFIFDPHVSTILDTGIVEQQFQTDMPAKWVRVGPLQRDAAIYGGLGRGYPLVSAQVGEVVTARLAPGWKGVTVVSAAGAANTQVFVLFTDEKYEVTVTT